MLDSLPVIKSRRNNNISFYGDVPKFTVRQAGPQYRQIATECAGLLKQAGPSDAMVGLADWGNDIEGMVRLRVVRKLKGAARAIVDIAFQQQGRDLYIELMHCNYLAIANRILWSGVPAFIVFLFVALAKLVNPNWLYFLLFFGPLAFGILIALWNPRSLQGDESISSMALRGSVLTILYDTLDSFGIPKNDIVDLVRL